MTDRSVVVAIAEFKAGIRGRLLSPGDDGYDDARRTWNGMFDRRPALIARCAGVADVVRAVNFGREHRLPLAVRGGGHSFPGYSVCDGGLVIDLSPMKSVRVDPVARVARAEAGAKWLDFDGETQAFGLATTGGTASDTGIAGLTLGGGLGWLSSKHGLTIDSLISADVVLANGTFMTTNASDHADLFWGLRGGGGNFGVVTSFEYRVHAVGPTIVGGMVAHPVGKTKEVLRFYREFNRAAPDELTTYAAFLTPPGGDTVVALVCCYSGPLDRGEKVLHPLKTFGSPATVQIGPMPYVALQRMLDEGLPPGSSYYTKGDFVSELTDPAIDVFAEYAATKPSPLSAVLVQTVRGAATRVASDATAFAHRRFLYAPAIVAQWLAPGDADRNVAWARGFGEALRAFAGGGAYVNDLSHDDGDRLRSAYGANYDRLAALKKTYDPDNLFRLNPNIKPAS